jgi:hypothetical protein
MKYFIGMSDPRTEARAAPIRGDKATFTQADYDAGEKGDLYFMKRSTGAQRFYVPTEGDEDETKLLVVTHMCNGYGWDPYDAEGNLVIPVWGASSGDPQYAAYRAIEQALYDTPIGKALGSEALRPVAQSLSEKFGMDRFEEYASSDRAFHVKDEDNEGVKTALKELLAWRPETGYWDELGKIGANSDGVGFAKDAEEYAKLINCESDGFGGKPHKSDKNHRGLPLMSQPVLYAVAGSKDAGRGIWSRVERLMSLVGLEWDDVR